VPVHPLHPIRNHIRKKEQAEDPFPWNMKQAISFYIAKLSYHNYKKEHIFDDDDDDDDNHALKLINKMETHYFT
jgi:hypothetical protein